MSRQNSPLVDQEVKFSGNEDLVSTTDKRGVITYANEAFCQVAGYKQDELVGHSHNIVRHPDMPKAAFKDLWDNLKNEKPWRGAVKNKCKDGRYYWVDAYVTPIYQEGELTGYQSVRTLLAPEYKENANKIYGKINNGDSLTSKINTPFMRHVGFFMTNILLIASTFYSPFFALFFLLIPFIFYYSELFIVPRYFSSLMQNYDSVSRYVYSSKQHNLITDFHFKLSEGKIKTILGRVIDSTRSLADDVNVLMNATVESKKGIENETAELHQVATAVEEMVATISEVAQNTETTATQIDLAHQNCECASHSMESTRIKVDTLAKDVSSSAEATQNLAEEVEKIGTIMQEIQGIADQTNLLALNAAIEAARAGEHGRGFAVVADEVRALSSRTHGATEHIHSSVNKIQSTLVALSSGMLTGKDNAELCLEETINAQSVVNDVYSAITEISNLAIQISTAAEEQSMVSAEIGRNITNINDVSQSNLKQALTVESETSSINSSITALKSLGVTFGE